MDDDTFRAAVRDRLATELDDADVATAVVAGIDAAALGRMRAVIGDDGAATAPLLRFRPTTASGAEVDAVAAFAFGNRLDDHGGYVGAGPVNLALAALADETVTRWAVPVFAQWEVAEHMERPNRSIEHRRNPDGSIDYLSTIGVAEQVRDLVSESGEELRVIGVLAFADHAQRCLQVVRSLGYEAGVPSELALPTEYDDGSGQPWTRSRAAYVASDLWARLAMSAG